ncbi:MAG: PadR family transcriptional regulator [Mycobacteriaceae bacterium]|nr:PadR family transcriptional regulator [Mycobacteriaceae bacterium]
MGKAAPGALTPLGVAVLAVLSERSMHPYEIYQLLVARREDRLVKVRPGSLYHAVARYAELGLVREVGTDREGNRPERTVYELTDCGWQALRNRVAELLGSGERDYPNFPLALAEAHNLPKDEVIELVNRRIARRELDIGELDMITRWAGERAVPRRYWIEVEYTRAVLTTEKQWMERLVDELTSGQLPWESFDPATGGRLPQADGCPKMHLPSSFPPPGSALTTLNDDEESDTHVR